MGWFRRKPENPYGYEDRAALKGIGGYEPADPADATPAHLVAEPWAASARGTRWPSPAPEPTTASSAFLTSLPEATPPPDIPARRIELIRAPSGWGLGIFVVGVAIVLAGHFLVTFSDGEAATTRSATTSVAPAPAPPEPSVVIPATVPGWRPVPGNEGRYAYDVPPSWDPRPGTIHGWEADGTGPGITLVTSAFTGEGYCAADPDLQRGGSGVTTFGEADPTRAANEIATTLATHAYTADGGPPPRLRPGERELVTVPIGQDRIRAAPLVMVEVTPTGDGGGCLPEKALVGALAVPASGQDGGIVLVAYAALDDAATRDELKRILRSFRTVPETDRHMVTAAPVRPAPTS